VFNPAGTTYELHLAVPKGAETPAASPRSVSAVIRCTARKVMTMPSGGNFVTPIFGPPRVLQGMVRYLDDRTAVLQAGVPVVVALPADDAAYDLNAGPIAPGVMINATLLAGATFELAKTPVGA
jgi:hypothetical protein